MPVSTSPFDLRDDRAYGAWRERKLARYPARVEDLLVEVHDPRRLTAAERAALLERCGRANMALYASPTAGVADKALAVALGQQLGLVHLDHNWLADDDAVTALSVCDGGERRRYIPYTDRPIRWHTDGYYNAPGQAVRGLILHCVHPAARGGANALLDPELVYILLRDEDPGLVAALMDPEAMTIPPGREHGGAPRPARTGPVFSVDAGGALHMRYTARRRNVTWKDAGGVAAAAARLGELLESDLPWTLRARLEGGMGLVSNNVLHDRAGFADAPGSPPRLLYRARYHERVRDPAPAASPENGTALA